MRSLNDYFVPEAMLNIESKLTPKEIEALVNGSAALESSEDDYVKAFTKMLHFEEVAESRFLRQFNAKNIRLRNVRDREYCIPNDHEVSANRTSKIKLEQKYDILLLLCFFFFFFLSVFC